MTRRCLVLTQLRNSSEYNDFVGRFYHFPSKYLSQFDDLPVDFVYYEPTKNGEGVYFGFGRVTTRPIRDKREAEHYFVEVSGYKPFLEPVPLKDSAGVLREAGSPHYNAQNAVRRISPEVLDEICLDGKILLNFVADAHLVKVLGEQLIASEKVGILELIKNSYDAEASFCKVRIEKVPSLAPVEGDYCFPHLPGPVITVEDDGVGMTRAVIENGWLRPASTIKTVLKEKIKLEREKAAREGKLATFEQLISEIKKERGGRIPLGEKGVGRFAAHRLGRRLILRTKTRDLGYEYVLEVDWDKFDAADNEVKNLEAVGISLSRQMPPRDYGRRGSGTQLVIYGGREGFSWDRDSIEDIHRSIASLNSPNPRPNRLDLDQGFRAYLECPQVTDLPTENPLALFPPTFSFDGLVDEHGVLEYSLKFRPPKTVPMPEQEFEEAGFDLRKVQVDYWSSVDAKELQKPECGSFYLHIDVWYRRDPWISTSGPDGKSFLDYLTRFGGISIYRDGINIFPAEWGAETDWLGLSKRHIKQAFRMSYYNMVGNLELDQARNIGLIDKTNREGLIENRAFKDLTHLVHATVATVIENRFIGKRDEYTGLAQDVVRDPTVLQEYAKQGAALIADIRNGYPTREDPYKILRSIGSPDERGEKLINLSRSLKNLQKSIELIEEAQDLLTEQAGYGMAVAVSVHEIAKIATNFYMGVSHLLRAKSPKLQELTKLKEASASLQSELKRLGPLRAVRTESRTEFGIVKPLRFVIELFRTRLKKGGIEVAVNNESFIVYGRYGALIQIFSNLFDNSIYWLGTSPQRNRKIEIHIDSRDRTVGFADSGPGIDDVILPYLFKPGYSMKIPPSGLGLFICRYYMQNMKGDVYLTTGRERIAGISGAQFTLDFGRVASQRESEKK